ncbi:MAG: dockerin type I repeat-containing protein [Candidatus Shapirobacteria bacterium]|jgi:hypothetical protein
MMIFVFGILCFFNLAMRPVWGVEDPTTYNVRVLFVKLSPVEGGEDMIKRFFGWQFSGKTTDQGLDLGINANISALKRLSNNRINYEVVKKVDISAFPKYSNGYVYDFAKYKKCTDGTDTAGECEKQKFYFDHIDWARSNNICRLAAENNIDEIWMASAPFITTWENFMIGPKDGFNVNGTAYSVPECTKNYVVMSSGWSTDSFAHIYGHRIEATMRYMTQYWKPEDVKKYWTNFAATDLYGLSYGSGAVAPAREAYCGNSHFPHNATKHYDTANKTYQDSTCKDWKNIPNFTGTRESINCDRWGCYDSGPSGWAEYWLGSMPREQGGINLVSNSGVSIYLKNNWWYYFLYPENAIRFLKETSGVAPTVTAKPTVVPTRVPTNTPAVPTVLPTVVPPTKVPTVRPTVTATATTTPACSKKGSGDANCDGVVNISDFAIWKTEFMTGGGQKTADFNKDGKVNIMDFGVWKVGFSER